MRRVVSLPPRGAVDEEGGAVEEKEEEEEECGGGGGDSRVWIAAEVIMSVSASSEKR